MTINFECQSCGRDFNSDVGQIHFDPAAERPRFEKAIICPQCGPRTMDDVYLTEVGQSQLTAAMVNR